ncbi:MAG: malonyl-ACP O-methyltransferase BioC [Gammaproteobacteria bacterium]|nr:malonyl-ACP O-methyltransferase BioC [Gammaproteobacteria bacterium]
MPEPAVLDPLRVRRQFERAAAGYDAAAPLHRQVTEEVMERLDYIRLAPRRILDAGCGTGFAGPRLASRYGVAPVELDLATAMLRVVAAEPRGPRVAGDAQRLPFAAASFDLVFSSLMLQWCEPQIAFPEFHRVLAPGGLLMFTSFGPDTLRELRAAWRAVDAGVHVHDFLDMHHLGDMLLATGFEDPVVDQAVFTLTYADFAGVVGDLRQLGAGNAARARPRGLTGRRRRSRLEQAYEAFRQADGRLPATYEVVFGHAWRRAGGRAVVPAASLARA